MLLQSAIRAIYPAQCIICDAHTSDDHGLCGGCWSDTHFIGGAMCDTCGVPLMGDDHGDKLQCDDCMTIARPWHKGRAVLAYSGIGRRIVLSLKHGDRTDLAVPAGKWMARVAAPMIATDTTIIPVPLHWSRMLKRRYNQSALLAGALAREACATYAPDALRRVKRTAPLDGHSRAARFDALDGAIAMRSGRAQLVTGRHVLLVDDVMTTGATLAACADAVLAAGARKVCIVALARVTKDT